MKTFCNQCNIKCVYLNEENKCSKSKSCKNISGEPNIFIPEDCEYYGSIFLKLEEIKQKVRQYKEEIVYYEAMLVSNSKEAIVYHKIIDSINKFIEKYIPYGANDW